MLIRLGYDIELDLPAPIAVVTALNVHPSRAKDLLEPDELDVSPKVRIDEYYDGFGNRCTRFLAPAGILRLRNSTLVQDSGEPDAMDRTAQQIPVQQLPVETLQFLVSSRYCEVDRLSNLAWELFGNCIPGWPMVQAICDWVHGHITFDYQAARPSMTAYDIFMERRGVCRDFQHLAIALCRAMHIPARYATGYMGDFGVPLVLPMDFSAWFEVYLDGKRGDKAGGQWWTLDARNNQPRIGRVLMATGRDAADVAMTTSFGPAWLKSFQVVSDEAATASADQSTDTDQSSDHSAAANAQNSFAIAG